MAQRLHNKIAIVTGGSKGIGKGIAKLYAAEGAKVVLNYASDDRAAQHTADEIRSLGGEITLCKGDVSKRADMQALTALTVATYGRIDILCANAGIYPTVTLEEMSEEDWDRVNDVNYKGTFLSAQACLPQMIAQKYGKIVVISSTTGVFTSLAREVHYGASKAGQVGFVRSASLPWPNITLRSTQFCPVLSLPKELRWKNTHRSGPNLPRPFPCNVWASHSTLPMAQSTSLVTNRAISQVKP